MIACSLKNKKESGYQMLPQVVNEVNATKKNIKQLSGTNQAYDINHCFEESFQRPVSRCFWITRIPVKFIKTLRMKKKVRTTDSSR